MRLDKPPHVYSDEQKIITKLVHITNSVKLDTVRLRVPTLAQSPPNCFFLFLLLFLNVPNVLPYVLDISMPSFPTLLSLSCRAFIFRAALFLHLSSGLAYGSRA